MGANWQAAVDNAQNFLRQTPWQSLYGTEISGPMADFFGQQWSPDAVKWHGQLGNEVALQNMLRDQAVMQTLRGAQENAARQFNQVGDVYKGVLDTARGQYGQTEQQIRDTNAGVMGDYNRARGELTRAGQSARQDLLTRERQQQSSAAQGLASRGLGNTTIGANLNRSIAGDTNRELAGVAERVGALRSGLAERTGAARAQSGQYLTDFMQRRTQGEAALGTQLADWSRQRSGLEYGMGTDQANFLASRQPYMDAAGNEGRMAQIGAATRGQGGSLLGSIGSSIGGLALGSFLGPVFGAGGNALAGGLFGASNVPSMSQNLLNMQMGQAGTASLYGSVP